MLPGRSFACSHKQHNGEYGCIFCLNPGVGNGPSRYWPDIHWPLRTEEIYKQQLVDKGQQKIYMGLKDKCLLSEFAPYPTCELIDDMHCDDGGIVKHLLTFYQSTDNGGYLSPGRFSQINKLLKKARYPREIKNGPKPLGTMHYWATHEFRTFFHSTAIYVFKDQ